jgi:uncharacterized protein (DUF3084 family)
MLSFGLKLIFLLAIVSGAIAITGNYIGRTIGRRHITFFNLRPRHTANAITILTGILIAIITVGTILFISQDARTALFGMEALRQNLTEKSAQLKETTEQLTKRAAEKEKIDLELIKARQEITSLEKVRTILDKEIEVSRKGKVMFQVNELLLTSLIKAGPEKDKIEAGLKQILSAADAYVRSFGAQGDGQLIVVSPANFEQVENILISRWGDNIIKVIVNQNTLLGEEIKARLEVSDNNLVYQQGDEIAQLKIGQSLTVPEIEQEIKKLLALTHLNARKAGVVPDASGSLGSVSYLEIYNLAKKIKATQKPVSLKCLAKEDIYAIGPLKVSFKPYYQ